MRSPLVFLCVLGALGVLGAREASAQLRRPRAEVAPLAERAGVRAGERIRVALKVSLPEGLHTQSNKPRDPLLIPTELTIDAPATVAVDEIVWPHFWGVQLWLLVLLLVYCAIRELVRALGRERVTQMFFKEPASPVSTK